MGLQVVAKSSACVSGTLVRACQKCRKTYPKDLDVFSFNPGKHGRFVYWRCRRDPPSERLVRVRRPDIQKRVAAFAGEHFRNHSFHGCPFVDVRCRFVGWDNGRGLSISQKRRVQKDNGRGRVLELADQRQFAEERAADAPETA
jgi:hypothetical protein